MGCGTQAELCFLRAATINSQPGPIQKFFAISSSNSKFFAYLNCIPRGTAAAISSGGGGKIHHPKGKQPHSPPSFRRSPLGKKWAKGGLRLSPPTSNPRWWAAKSRPLPGKLRRPRLCRPPQTLWMLLLLVGKRKKKKTTGKIPRGRGDFKCFLSNSAQKRVSGLILRFVPQKQCGLTSGTPRVSYGGLFA